MNSYETVPSPILNDPACTICGEAGSIRVRLNGSFVGNQCLTCETISTVTKLDRVKMNSERYPLDERLALYHRRRKEFHLRYSQCAAFAGIQSQMKVLEVGSNTGAFVAFLTEMGCEVSSVEINVCLADYQRNIGIDCKTSIREPSQLQDIIVLMDVLEHIPSCVDTLRDLGLMLRPGGRIFLQFPNHKSWAAHRAGVAWAWWEAPDHLHHFTPTAMQYLASKSGLEVLKQRTVSPVVDDIRAAMPRFARCLDLLNRFAPINTLLPLRSKGSLIQVVMTRNSAVERSGQ
jgi:SAM-dependent methyltransferase